MAPITNKANSNKQAQFRGNIGPTVTNIGLDKQVNTRITTQFGDKIHFMANVIQTSSKDELANYLYQSLGSSTTWSILNALKNYPSELMAMPVMNKDLITKYLDPSIATAKGNIHLRGTPRGRRHGTSTTNV